MTDTGHECEACRDDPAMRRVHALMEHVAEAASEWVLAHPSTMAREDVADAMAGALVAVARATGREEPLLLRARHFLDDSLARLRTERDGG